MCQMKIVLKDGSSEKIVLEDAALLEVTGEGVQVNALFEEAQLIQGAAVSRIDFLQGKVTVTKSAGNRLTSDPKTTAEKLQVLLPHWIEHNHNHRAEFMKWATLAREGGVESVAGLLEQASASIAATDEILKKALAAVGGTGPAHHAHQHG